MKKSIIFGCGMLLLAACGNGIEKKANEKLTIARTAYERGNYAETKSQIDSIKILYPKAFEAREAGQALMLDVELKIQEQKLDSLGRTLQDLQQAFNEIESRYVLEKDTAYQQIGNYLWPAQTVEKNLHRAYLRFQVNEQGVMSMTSIYCGNSNIHHFKVKVSTPDGTSAETPRTKDSYETTDLNEKIEKADYKLGEDGGVIEFLAGNKDKNIRVEFIGDRQFTTNMLPADRQAAAGIHELSQLLSQMTRIKKAQEEARLKIGFIHKKKEIKAKENAAE